jgi:hypothetical protein
VRVSVVPEVAWETEEDHGRSQAEIRSEYLPGTCPELGVAVMCFILPMTNRIPTNTMIGCVIKS